MGARQFSIILLPTLRCNADCDYCFEDRGGAVLSLDGLAVIIDKVLDHLVTRGIDELQIHWQGGEVMTLPPDWFTRAHELIRDAAAARGRTVVHGLQSNLLGYDAGWNPVIREMFGNSVSTSCDWPNLYRHRPGRDPADYDARWRRNLDAARAAGIDVQVIAVPNAATLAAGGEAFYRYFVETLGINSFQVNTPFPGGTANQAKAELPLGGAALTGFFLELAEVWLTQGRDQGVRVGPFDELLAWFSGEPALKPCIWTEDCTRYLVAIDAQGHLAQCDCWVSSYPDYRFGNLFGPESLGDLLTASAVRRRFQERPARLLAGDCIDCQYLALCHGGCPVRAFTGHGALEQKDPWCELYQALFGRLADAAAQLAQARAARAGTHT